MTAQVVDEFGHAEYDNTIGEHIMNSLDRTMTRKIYNSSMLMMMQVMMSMATKRVEIRCTTMMTGR